MRINHMFLMLWVLLVLTGCGALPEEETKAPPAHLETVKKKVVVQHLSVEEKVARLREIAKQLKYDFKLGKGDRLSISVYGEPDLTKDSVPIRPDGKISFPLAGNVQAAGLSVEELEQRITERLRDYIRNPKVSVIVRKFASLTYTISGEVARAGVYPIEGQVTLIQAVARAGGFRQVLFRGSSRENADLEHAYIVRKDKVLPVDFVRLFRKGDMRFNIQVMPGDYIYIPSGLAQEVYVLGEVGSPAVLAYHDGLTVTNVLAQSAGFTPNADLSRVHVIRGNLSNPEVFIVNMKDVFEGKARDLMLEPNVIVYVPPTYLTTWSRIIGKIIPSLQSLQGFLPPNARILR